MPRVFLVAKQPRDNTRRVMTTYYLAQVMEKLLKDGNTMVLGSAVAAFTEVRFHRHTVAFLQSLFVEHGNHTQPSLVAEYGAGPLNRDLVH